MQTCQPERCTIGITFPRVLAEFAANNLGTVVNDAMVSEYLGEEIIGHVSRDSTAIKDRKKTKKKVKQPSLPANATMNTFASGSTVNKLSKG